MYLLKNEFPDLAQELEKLLLDENEADLAAQVGSIRIVDRCRCGDWYCATIYTAPPPEGAYGPGSDGVSLDPSRGMLTLDLVDRQIMCIEILYRDDVRKKLLKLLP